MQSQAVDDVLDPVLQQFYSSSSSHSSSVLKVPVVLQRTAMKGTKIYNARAQLMFCSLNLLFSAGSDVLVAVVDVVCLSSLASYWWFLCDAVILQINKNTYHSTAVISSE